MMISFHRSFLLCVLLCALCCAPLSVVASEHGGGHGGEASKADAKAEQKSKKKDTATITGGQGADDPVYLHMAPITLPIINDYGAQQIVTMLVDLQIKDFQTAESMQKQMPKLKDALLQSLYGALADGSVRNANALDIVKIKANIMETLTVAFEDGAVKEVYVQAVSQRKL